MPTYAVIDATGLCVNTVVWDGMSEYHAGDGFTMRDIDGVSAGIGWRWINPGVWQPPQPFPSWTWNGTEWVAPVPMPTEGGPWSWDEDTQTWVEPDTSGE